MLDDGGFFFSQLRFRVREALTSELCLPVCLVCELHKVSVSFRSTIHYVYYELLLFIYLLAHLLDKDSYKM